MGHFLRYGFSCRLTKCLFQSTKVQNQRNIQRFPRLFATSKSTEEELSSAEKESPLTVNDSFHSDLTKFQNENKVTLPKSTVIAEDYALGPQDDPDTFGSLAETNPYLLSTQEGSVEDEIEDKFVSELPRRLPQKAYADMIKKYLKQRRFADALDVLQVTMLKEHRVKPEYYIYSILISYCGLTGYSKMAFKLYSEMKRRNLKVTPAVYTSLFNSFANSPFPSDGLQRTRKLFSYMNEKNIQINEMTCHAVIKAFARCGSVEEAFKVVDYMMERKMPCSGDTFNFLMQACISDKESGFRHVLLVYRKLMQYRIVPSTITYNLLLRCVRDCSMGDIDSTIDVLKRLNVDNVDKLHTATSQPQLEGYAWEEGEELSSEIVSGSGGLKQASTESSKDHTPTSLLPDLLARHPTLGCIVSLTEMVKPEDRLFLLGGVDGFLKQLQQHNNIPDVKTFNLLLECSPQTLEAEKHLLKLSKQMHLNLDVLFFNTLIRRRVQRQHYSEARDVLDLMAVHNLSPDLMTFTNLAMACRDLAAAKELLQVMDASGIRPGIELITAMFGSATYPLNIYYVNFVFDVIEFEEMKVNAHFLKKSDYFYKWLRGIMENGQRKQNPSALKAMKKFCDKYPQWRKSCEIDEEPHPWQHLREKYPVESETDEGFLNEYVEQHTPMERDFQRVKQNTIPKLGQAKLKRLKEENPEMFKRKSRTRTSVDGLEGISSVTYQALLTKES